MSGDMLQSLKSGLRCFEQRATKAAAPHMLPASLIARRGPRDKARIALTFDDGPHELTLAYLDVLEHYRARATFFVVGSACLAWPNRLETIAARGHELGNHGFTHKRFSLLSPAELEVELERTFRLLPAPAHRLVRPPHGSLSIAALMTCAGAGYRTVLWSRDSMDWHNKRSEAVVAATFGRPVEAGEIILLHEGQDWTLRALPTIIERLLESRYELVTVGEMLDT